MLEGGLRLCGKTKNDLDTAPLVSIITVVYNNEKMLGDTIRGVLNQSYSNIEYLIIDGGSTDGTLDVIKAHEQNIDYWLSEPDKGIYDAMNKGISLSKGSIIGLINSDDWYEKDAVKDAVEKFQSDDSIGATYSNEKYIFSIGKKKYIRELRSSPVVNLSILNGNTICHPSVFIKKMVYDRVGLYDTTYKICADWELMIRIHLYPFQFAYIPKSNVVGREGGISSTTYKQCKKDVIRIKKKYGSYSYRDRMGYLVAIVKESINKNMLGQLFRTCSKLIKKYLKKYDHLAKTDL